MANSGAGKASLAKRPEALASLLDTTGIEYEIALTSHPGHGIELASQAVKEGLRYVIAVGGDGTINEVVDGMLTARDQGSGIDGAMANAGQEGSELVLGVIPDGSGSDFVRTFGLPAKPADAVKHLSGEAFFEVDVGRIGFTDKQGARQSRYFVNIAEAGLGGEIARRAQLLPRSMGRWRYLLSFWMTLGRFKQTKGTIKLDQRTYQGPITNLVVANAQFYGGGMRIAPKAHPADGKFDVLIMKGNKRDYVAGISKVYKGRHLPSPVIKEYMSSGVEVTADAPLQIEADGEVLGFTPATFEIVPNAYRLKI